MSKLYTPSNVISKIEWINVARNEIKTLRQVGVYDDFRETLFNTNGFYSSTYCCPECARSPLYKMQVHGLKSKYYDEVAILYNIFTCPNCRRFYASVLNAGTDTITIEESSQLSNFGIYSDRYDFSTYQYLLELMEDTYHNYPTRIRVIGNNLYDM
ncbi:hypothetical protein [Clostridium tertium]|uniref:hypothetical protein n=1 Tax=Clostridium tertium TaxID=1559 RepID=UPI0022E46374|nr:hypothetical protein [Clostridium tertium]